jgi:hypothetical protein
VAKVCSDKRRELSVTSIFDLSCDKNESAKFFNCLDIRFYCIMPFHFVIHRFVYALLMYTCAAIVFYGPIRSRPVSSVLRVVFIIATIARGIAQRSRGAI